MAWPRVEMSEEEISRLPPTRKQAIARGERYYYTGKECSRGHIAIRTVTNGCTMCSASKSATYRKKRPMRRRVNDVKTKCLRAGIPFDTEAYIEAWENRGTHCPALGLEFSAGGTMNDPCQPEMDRIIPELGYVRGNIWVISRQANKMKNDGTAAMLRQIADAVDKRIAEGENHARSSKQKTPDESAQKTAQVNE